MPKATRAAEDGPGRESEGDPDDPLDRASWRRTLGDMRTLFVVPLAVTAGILGCAAAPQVVPAATPSAATDGVTLTVRDSEWTGYPDDLTDYLTPVRVSLYNGSSRPVRVSYVDFALTDARGFRYAAINPYAQPGAPDQGSPGSPGAAPGVAAPDESGDGSGSEPGVGEPQPSGAEGVPAPQLGLDESAPRVLLAARGPRVYVAPPPPGRVRVAPPPPARPRYYAPYRRPYRSYGPRVYVAPRPYFHFYAYPYYRPWFGPAYPYWSAPFAYPPGYYDFVWRWGPSEYPSPMPPDDVVQRGLPEGVLQPGGRVEGFLYFQRAHADATRLDLTWQPHDAQSGQVLGTSAVELRMVR